tara:strand:+ start:185 stop:484 length:300 start_codon:yes stop_codon:yes gene_type:complete
MPNPQKQEYYRKNREKRLKYQHEWYEQNKSVVERKDEILQVADPEEWERKREKKRKYNRAYYLKNRVALLAKQRAKYVMQEEEGDVGITAPQNSTQKVL